MHAPGDAPWYFTADIYESLSEPAVFFPLFRRRETYRMKARDSEAPENTVTDVVEASFEGPQFKHASASSALTAVTGHVTEKFTQPGRHKQPVKLRQAFEIERPGTGETFVVRIYDGLGRKTRSFSVSRRGAYQLSGAFTGRAMSGLIEVREPSLDRKRLAATSSATALKAIAASIDRLP